MSLQAGLSTVAKSLKKGLEKRFTYVLDPCSLRIDGIYLAATLLNPPYQKILSSSQVNNAKIFIISMMTSESESDGSSQSIQSQDENQPPPKRFKHLSLVCDLFDQEGSTTSEVLEQSKEDEETEKYLESKPNLEEIKVLELELIQVINLVLELELELTSVIGLVLELELELILVTGLVLELSYRLGIGTRTRLMLVTSLVLELTSVIGLVLELELELILK